MSKCLICSLIQIKKYNFHFHIQLSLLSHLFKIHLSVNNALFLSSILPKAWVFIFLSTYAIVSHQALPANKCFGSLK